MADPIAMYGDFTPREAGKAWKQLEKRAVPMMVTERFAQTRPMQKNQTKVMIFRRVEKIDPATTPLMEGVSPEGSKPTYTDIQAVIQQYGDFIPFTDQLEDFNTDNIISEFGDVLSEQIQETIEVLNIAVLKSGTTVYYAGNVANRGLVADFTTVGQFKKVERFLRDQKAKLYTKILAGSPRYGTTPVPASFVALCDTDLKADFEALPGWKSVETYAEPAQRLHEYEIGSVGSVRVIASPMFDAWPDAGAAAATKIGTTNPAAACDVYPILVLGMDAWATIPMRNGSTGHPVMVSTKPSKSDPIGQRGSIGWKIYHCAVILNDNFMARIEVAAVLNPA